MGLFNKKKQEGVEEEEVPQRRGNPSTMFMFRLLAVGYVLWLLKDLVVMYIEGGEDAPSLLVLIGTAVVFIGGSVWIIIMTVRQYKQMKAEQEAEAAAAEAEAAALKEAEAMAELEEYEEYEDYEETEESTETEE